MGRVPEIFRDTSFFQCFFKIGMLSYAGNKELMKEKRSMWKNM